MKTFTCEKFRPIIKNEDDYYSPHDAALEFGTRKANQQKRHLIGARLSHKTPRDNSFTFELTIGRTTTIMGKSDGQPGFTMKNSYLVVYENDPR